MTKLKKEGRNVCVLVGHTAFFLSPAPVVHLRSRAKGSNENDHTCSSATTPFHLSLSPSLISIFFHTKVNSVLSEKHNFAFAGFV